MATSVYDTIVEQNRREQGLPLYDKDHRVLLVVQSQGDECPVLPYVGELIREGYEVTQVANTRGAIAELVRRFGSPKEYFGRVIFDGKGKPYERMEEFFWDFVLEMHE